jgi:diguanylate cyclase (GGDEF)-like protein
MRERTYTVLVVGSDPAMPRLLQESAQEPRPKPLELVCVGGIDEATASLGKDHFDAVLLDLTPDGAGCPDTFLRLRDCAAHVPILVAVAATNERLGFHAVRAGAQDFLPKVDGAFRRLPHAVCCAVERYRLQSALQALTCLDELTGLYNRRGFVTVGDQQLRLARRHRSGLWLLFADLDDLKSINDRHGHRAGDAALVAVSAALRCTFRRSDVLARFGGDEFAVLALDAAGGCLNALLGRLRDNLRGIGDAADDTPPGLSIGAARFDPEDSATLEDLVQRADQAMYADKRGRRSPDAG